MIVVAGEALVDIVSGRETPGGGPFNTARALARLGVPAAFLGRLSSDARGRKLAALLERDGVSLRFVSVGPEPTTVARATLDASGVATYEFEAAGTSAPNLTAAMLPPALDAGVEALHVGTLGLLLEPMATTLIELVRRDGAGRIVMLDPNVRPGLGGDDGYRNRLREVIAMSSIVKASDSDVDWIFGTGDAAAGARAILDLGARLAVVTLGASGAFAADGRRSVRAPAPAVQVVDTIGAGDAFGAALLAWLHDHDALHEPIALGERELTAALEYACLAASLTCAREGADPPTGEEMAAGKR